MFDVEPDVGALLYGEEIMRFVDEYRAPEQVMQLIEHLRERAAASLLHCRTSVAHYGSLRGSYPRNFLNWSPISYCPKHWSLFTARLSGLRAADGTPTVA